MNKATQIEVGDTIRIIKSRQLSHDALVGHRREVIAIVRKYRARPAQVSIRLTGRTHGDGLIVNIPVEDVRHVPTLIAIVSNQWVRLASEEQE